MGSRRNGALVQFVGQFVHQKCLLDKLSIKKVCWTNCPWTDKLSVDGQIVLGATLLQKQSIRESYSPRAWHVHTFVHGRI